MITQGELKEEVEENGKIFGGIFAHGGRFDNDFVIIPRGIRLWPLVDEGYNLEWQNQIGQLDFDIMEDHLGRSYINKEFFGTKIFESGDCIPNITLDFCVTFKSGNGHTTGVVTNKKIHREFVELDEFDSDNELMNELMKPHDESIIPKKKLWKKQMKLGEVLKLIVDAKKFGTYYGIFCRSVASNLPAEIPSYLSIKKDDKFFHSSFEERLNLLETRTKNKDFNDFVFKENSLKFSKLKMRITFSVLTHIIRLKLRVNNTMSNLDFYSVIEICETKKVPVECVQLCVDFKLNELVKNLDMVDLSCVVIETKTIMIDTLKFKFKMVLIDLCKKLRLKLSTCLIEFQDEIDLIIFVCEKIINKEKISTNFYNKIREIICLFT